MPIWIVYVSVMLLFLGCNSGNDTATKPPSSEPSGVFEGDVRSYQHGVDFLKRSEGRYWLVWASSGVPPQGEDEQGEWIHDVYAASINANNPEIKPFKLISEVRAQEPSSAAVAADGKIMITMEDAFEADDVYAQTYAIYDASLNPVKPYRHIVANGGHSGHVTAAGGYFVVAYSEGWVDGGGVDDLGSGDDVLLATYTSRGDLLHVNDVAVGERTRDWWPLLAGSPKYVLVLWQQFVDDETHARLLYRRYDPETNSWRGDAAVLLEAVQYYTYDVQYLEALDSFLIYGTDAQGVGFARLLTQEGTMAAYHSALPPLVREAQPAIRVRSDDEVTAVYPSAPTGLTVLSVGSSSIELERTVAQSYRWFYSGTDGIFTDDNSVYFVSLSPDGIKEVRSDLK